MKGAIERVTFLTYMYIVSTVNAQTYTTYTILFTSYL